MQGGQLGGQSRAHHAFRQPLRRRRRDLRGGREGGLVHAECRRGRRAVQHHRVCAARAPGRRVRRRAHEVRALRGLRLQRGRMVQARRPGGGGDRPWHHAHHEARGAAAGVPVLGVPGARRRRHGPAHASAGARFRGPAAEEAARRRPYRPATIRSACNGPRSNRPPARSNRPTARWNRPTARSNRPTARSIRPTARQVGMRHATA